MAKQCSIEACGEPARLRGMCKRHYSRAYRGLPLEPKVLQLPKWVCEADLAYAAGFIDADGSILIGRDESPRNAYGIRHYPRVCAGGIDRAPLEFLQSMFGGAICLQRHLHSDPVKHRFPFYQWSVSHNRAIDVARYLMPYLKIKGVQAYLLSCFEYEAEWTKGGADQRMPMNEFFRREALVAEMRDWNGRSYLEKA